MRLFTKNMTWEILYVHFCIYKDMVFVNAGKKIVKSDSNCAFYRFISPFQDVLHTIFQQTTPSK